MKSKLFLLKAEFDDPRIGTGKYHCPECARVEGILSFFPKLRADLEVVYLDFPRPRAGLIELVGEGNQSCPVLVLAAEAPSNFSYVREAESGAKLISGAESICDYLARTMGTSLPHP